MALAVAEAHRVLKPNGLLLDVHPADEASTLEAWHIRAANTVQCVALGALDYEPNSLSDYTATSEALAIMLDEGTHFKFDQVVVFEYQYFFETIDQLTTYLADNHEFAQASADLINRTRLALPQATSTSKIVIIQKSNVTALRKI